MRKLALLLVIVLALLPASALADVSKGDRGEEVRYLQWLLVNTGWLFEEPDGVFGGHTQQAVKDYQKYKGYPQTGTADYALMEEIEADRARMDREIYGNDYYQPYDGDFTPPFETGAAPEYASPAHCATAVLPALAWRDACERHLALMLQETELCRFDDVQSIAQACALWRKDIRAAFSEWIAEAPAQDRLAILSAWVNWNAAFDAQHEAMLALWEEGPAVQRQLTQMARDFALALCELRSGEPVTDPDIGVEASSSDVADPFCMEWTEGVGTEYVSCCQTHAPAFDQEYRWIAQGGEDKGALSSLASAWTDALNEQYEQWLGMCGEYQAPAVRRARDAAVQAVEQLSAAFAPDYGPVGIATVRAVQFEVARLCEMLNAAMAG